MKSQPPNNDNERFQLRDRPGPDGVTLSAHATREEADKALATRIAEARPGEAPLIADVGVKPAPTPQSEAIEAGKTAEQKEAERASKNPPPAGREPVGTHSYEDARR